MADLKKIDLVVLQVVPSVARFLLLSITCLALSRALEINNNQTNNHQAFIFTT